MPDRRKHRGPHPEDLRLFGPDVLPVLRRAAGDLAWLLSRGYPSRSALKLVGDRYDLVARQRTAVGRCVCSDDEVGRRRSCRMEADRLPAASLWIDGFNVLTTVEAALAGGVILSGRDGTFRDMASMHGSFRRVAETLPALELLGETTTALGVGTSVWYLDSPVSNSGRLKGVMEELALVRGWHWQVQLVNDPDAVLIETDRIVATADSRILDQCSAWFNLAREAVARHIPKAWAVELIGEG